jgi:type IV pilus assembly protein PilN
MRITVNLATRPFVELRPILLRLRIGMAALILLAVGLAIGNHLLARKAAAAEGQMDQVRQKTVAFETERQTSEHRMQQPQNRAVLERSQLLNGLFQQKSFSWTAVMMDLERVLPEGVQVTSIEPAVTPEGEVNIRLRVSGQRERAIELVRNLERSRRFVNPHLANESAQAQEKGRVQTVAAPAPGAVEFDILSGYNPLPDTRAAATPGAKRDLARSAAKTSSRPQEGSRRAHVPGTPRKAGDPANAGGRAASPAHSGGLR